MVVGVEDSEDEAEEEASAKQKDLAVEKVLAVVAAQLLVITVEL